MAVLTSVLLQSQRQPPFHTYWDPGPRHLSTMPVHHHNLSHFPIPLPASLIPPIPVQRGPSLATQLNHLWVPSSSTSSHCQFLFRSDLSSKTTSSEGSSLTTLQSHLQDPLLSPLTAPAPFGSRLKGHLLRKAFLRQPAKPPPGPGLHDVSRLCRRPVLGCTGTQAAGHSRLGTAPGPSRPARSDTRMRCPTAGRAAPGTCSRCGTGSPWRRRLAQPPRPAHRHHGAKHRCHRCHRSAAATATRHAPPTAAAGSGSAPGNRTSQDNQ